MKRFWVEITETNSDCYLVKARGKKEAEKLALQVHLADAPFDTNRVSRGEYIVSERHIEVEEEEDE